MESNYFGNINVNDIEEFENIITDTTNEDKDVLLTVQYEGSETTYSIKLNHSDIDKLLQELDHIITQKKKESRYKLDDLINNLSVDDMVSYDDEFKTFKLDESITGVPNTLLIVGVECRTEPSALEEFMRKIPTYELRLSTGRSITIWINCYDTDDYQINISEDLQDLLVSECNEYSKIKSFIINNYDLFIQLFTKQISCNEFTDKLTENIDN